MLEMCIRDSPRTIAQAEALKKMLAERGQEVSVMLDLDVPEEELMTRLIKRGQESGLSLIHILCCRYSAKVKAGL